MDSTSFLSSNVRGASNITSRHNIKAITGSTKATFLCLQETKTMGWSDQNIKTLVLGNEVGWLEAPSSGLSGGILTAWNRDIINVTEEKVEPNWIGVRDNLVGLNTEFICFNVYAPQKLPLKKQLWNELSTYIKNL